MKYTVNDKGENIFSQFVTSDVNGQRDGFPPWWRHQMEKKLPRYCPFVRGIHRSTVHSPHKGQLRGDLMFSLICAWINAWANNREAGDLRRHRTHYDVTVMVLTICTKYIILQLNRITLLNRSSRYWKTRTAVLKTHHAQIYVYDRTVSLALLNIVCNLQNRIQLSAVTMRLGLSRYCTPYCDVSART